ncbi:zinc ribbon domain-containing protein, partial [Candidatus Hakubella thermalkaliphila]
NRDVEVQKEREAGLEEKGRIYLETLLRTASYPWEKLWVDLGGSEDLGKLQYFVTSPKEFRSKFQRWTYSKLISRIQQLSEVGGVHCQMIAPAYTSQTCSRCGFVHKLNRNGEIFKCRQCDCTLDADWNASLNILNLGLAQQSMVAGNMKGNVCL